jgi:hypothetical protein
MYISVAGGAELSGALKLDVDGTIFKVATQGSDRFGLGEVKIEPLSVGLVEALKDGSALIIGGGDNPLGEPFKDAISLKNSRSAIQKIEQICPAAQTITIGPASAWEPPENSQFGGCAMKAAIEDSVKVPDCMAANGAPSAAVAASAALTQALGEPLYIEKYRAIQNLQILLVVNPTMGAGLRRYLIVNGDPPIIEVGSAGNIAWGKVPKSFSDGSPWHYEFMDASMNGAGQKTITFAARIAQCRTCPVSGVVEASLVFSGHNKLINATPRKYYKDNGTIWDKIAQEANQR